MGPLMTTGSQDSSFTSHLKVGTFNNTMPRAIISVLIQWEDGLLNYQYNFL